MNPAKPTAPTTGSLRRTGSLNETAAWEKYFEYLLKALRDPDATARIRAAEMLGENKDPRAVSALSGVLGDPVAGVRLSAAKSLSKMGQVALDGLITATQDPDKEVRQVAVKALGQFADSLGISALMLALRDTQMDVRNQAAFALSRIGGPAVTMLIAALHDPDANIRASCARILGQIGDPRALPALEDMVNDHAKSLVPTGSLVNVAEAARQAAEKIKGRK